MSLASLHFIKANRLTVIPETYPPSSQLISASGKSLDIVGRSELSIQIAGLHIPVTVKVAQVLSHDLILGLDFLERNQAVIDYKQGVISLADNLIAVPLFCPQIREGVVTCVETMCIPANTEMVIPVKSPTYFDGKTILLEPIISFQFRPVATAHSINECQGGKTVCRIGNFKPYSITLRRGMQLAKITTMDVVASCTPEKIDKDDKPTIPRTVLEPQECGKLEEFAEEYSLNINPTLTPEQKQELLQVLYDYRNVFAKGILDLKRYPFYEHDIELLSNKRVQRRNYKCTPEDAEIMNKQIDEMFKMGVIEESTSHCYNSPCFLVAKKTGDKRLVCDLRQLNAIIKPVTVQMPKIGELIDDITSQDCRWISSADLKSAFWHIPLTPSSRPYTTFTSPAGKKYQYTVTPFGLSTSPAALQTVLLNVFASASSRNLYIYMDDIAIVTSTWEDHLQAIERMLKTLDTNCLTANGAKCQWGYHQMNFLGFVISADGIRVDPKRIKIIEKLGPPKNRKGLQRLLGLFNYWRRFIQGYTVNTFNMRQLLLEDKNFEWNAECERELEYLKTCLMQDPVLAPVNPNEDFVIMSDAAGKNGLGYQILQRGPDGLLHAVAFGGRALTKVQQRWHSSSLELAALAMAVKEYESIAIHRKIFCLTDNAKVLALDQWTPQGQRERRLISFLMQFRLTIRYVPGCRNCSADALSRSFADMKEEDRKEFLPTVEDERDDFILAISNYPKDLCVEEDPLETPEEEEEGYRTYTLITNPQDILDVQAVTTRSHSDRIQNEATDQTVNDQTGEMDQSKTDIQPSDDKSQATWEVIQSGIHDSSLEPMDSSEEAAEPLTENDQLKDQESELLMNNPLPPITREDYLEDEEWKNLYILLSTNTFDGNDKEYRHLLFIMEDYVIEEDKLYKISLPRGKKQQRAYPVKQRLCIPKKFRFQLLQHYHDLLGHYASERVFLTMYPTAHWKTMYLDIKNYCDTCDVCLRAKRNFKFKTKPLNYLEIPERPFQHIQLDYKDLTRHTDEGSVAVLCIVDAFSGYPILCPVKDMSAETAAKTVIKEVITKHGVFERLQSDRGSVFISKFFAAIMKELGIKHRISSARSPRTNGLAESIVKRLVELVRVYGQNDRHLDEILPLCEMCLRACNHSVLKLSPYEIIYGYKMPTGLPVDLNEKRPKLPPGQENYIAWLRHKLQHIHSAVTLNQQENKEEMKNKYDRLNKVQEPCWKVGDKVLMWENKIKPGGDQVLTHRRYIGPYIIAEVVQGSKIGAAYKLVHWESGRALKSLIGADRLKKYTADERENLSDKLPGIKKSEVKKAEPLPQDLEEGFEPAKKIVRQRTVNGKIQYLVLFQDKSSHWCEEVTNALLEDYLLRKAKHRRSN